jgi:hypothetical protein
MDEDDLCIKSDLPKEWCAHCLGHVAWWEQ